MKSVWLRKIEDSVLRLKKRAQIYCGLAYIRNRPRPPQRGASQCPE